MSGNTKKRGFETSDLDVLKQVMGAADAPDVKEIAYQFIHFAGGPKAFAKVLYQNFKNSKSTPYIKSQIMNLMLTTLKHANEKDPLPDLGQLSEEDLYKVLQDQLEKANHRGEEVVDADADAAPAG